ncbi:hypothetical protein [Nocardia noduli]|uniref:hypothetical protein n=1 Tax=Nocardia noduli TaxID=2815722 RepID=UPI001C222D95|nr:hypothetical protein [Nocardia noduli]
MIRVHTALLACAATACAVAAAPAAQAAVLIDSPTSTTVILTPAEASALSVGNIGGILGQLPPTFTPEAKTSLGHTLTRLAGQAAADQHSTMIIVIEGPLTGPTAVSVGVLS